VNQDRLEMQLAFLMEADRLKWVNRGTVISDASRHENTAEHSWHVSLMAHVLKEYALPGTNVDHAVTLLLNHDIVEIDAGDAYAYDEVARAAAPAREHAAAQRIYRMLPPEQATHFIELWREFEMGQTNEAKFARALDRLQPVMQNFATRGVMWKAHGVTRQMVVAKCQPSITAGAPELWHTWFIPLIRAADEQDFFAPTRAQDPTDA